MRLALGDQQGAKEDGDMALSLRPEETVGDGNPQEGIEKKVEESMRKTAIPWDYH